MGGSVMASIINATTTGLTVTPDNSGQLTLSANGVTALTANTTGYLNFAKQPQIAGSQWPVFSAYTDGDSQTVSDSTWTKITLDNEEFDPNGNFASSRYTPTIAGYYNIMGEVSYGNASTSGQSACAIYKNGNRFKDGNTSPFTNVLGSYNVVHALIYFNGSTDYVELYTFQDTGSTRTVNTNSEVRTIFQGFLVRAA